MKHVASLALLASLVLGLASASAQTVVNFAAIDRLQNGGSSWAVPAAGDNQLLVGRSGVNTNVFMIAFTFDVQAVATQIADAQSITLTIKFDTLLGNNLASNPFNLELIGFGKTSTAVVAGDATVAGTSAGSISTSTLLTAPGSLTYDVTSIAKSLIDAESDFIGFRLTSNLAAGSTPNDRLVGFYRTTNSSTNPMAADGVQLTITPIPEPSAFAALAGLAVLGLAATRRRRR